MKIDSANSAIGRTKNTSTIQTKLRDISKAEKDITTAEKKISELEKKLSKAEKDLAEEQKKVEREEEKADNEKIAGFISLKLLNYMDSNL